MSTPPPHSSAHAHGGTHSNVSPSLAINKPMRVVFIGNIPYDTTEEQLLALFSTVGPVQSLRLVFDRETGKPKGYGFCEYQDTETARSCVRNLSNYEFNGRNLRLDFADSMLGAPKEIRKENKTTRAHRPNEEYLEMPTSGGSFWEPFTGNPQLGMNTGLQSQVDSSQHQNSMPQPMMMMMQGIPPPPPPPMAYFQASGINSSYPQSNLMMGPPPQGGYHPSAQQQSPFSMHHQVAGMQFTGSPAQFQMVPPNFHGGFTDQATHSIPQTAQGQVFIPQSAPPQEISGPIPPPPPPANSMTTLESLPPEQLFSLLSHIKNLTQTQPSQAKDLLSTNPHLTYALFHILWRMDLIDAQTIQRTISSLSGAESVSTSPPIARQDPRKTASSGSQAESLKSDQQQALLDQIRRMTPEQIDALPIEQREKILLLKSKV